MGTLFTFLIIITAITILRFAKDSYKDYKKVAKKGGIRDKYKVLINYFIDTDPKMKIIKETNLLLNIITLVCPFVFSIRLKKSIYPYTLIIAT